MTALNLINMQPIEKRVARDDGALEIVGKPFATIQGEGPFAGRSSVFVRTAGCTLNCELCDTNYTSDRRPVAVSDLVREVRWQRSPVPRTLVVITGGEPFRQACGRFAAALLNADYDVQFETNGTLYDPTMEALWDRVTVVCSPKTGDISDQLKPHVTALKYIVGAGEVDPVDGLPTSSLNFGVRPCRPWAGFKGEVFVQPCDHKDAEVNKRNTQAAVDSCLKYGHRFCLQIHKILELP